MSKGQDKVDSNSTSDVTISGPDAVISAPPDTVDLWLVFIITQISSHFREHKFELYTLHI